MAATQAGVKRFYIVFGVLAVLGLAVLGYLLMRPSTVSIPANVVVQPSDTSGFAGYLKGSPAAPVEITEFADYQCPFCQTFATLQMPTIEERLINTGRVRWRYRDFPLEDRKSTRLNSSHLVISYAVFCLKKNKTTRARRRAACHAPSMILGSGSAQV